MRKIIEAEEQKERRLKKHEQSLRDVWVHICIVGVPEREEEREKEVERTS